MTRRFLRVNPCRWISNLANAWSLTLEARERWSRAAWCLQVTPRRRSISTNRSTGCFGEARHRAAAGASRLGFSARDGWNHTWTASQEGLAFIETLHTYFVVLGKDGRFSISGVSAGDYDLALRLYEPPGDGCLVNPVGAKVIHFQVSEEAARGTAIDLGEIPVKVTLGPRPGELVPDITFVDASGKSCRLSALRGRYVLVDFWATWCAPCVASLPEIAKLQAKYGKNDHLAILGLNIDDDPGHARAFAAQKELSWTQGFLGQAQDKDEILSRYAVSSVPTYVLIGPDGKLVDRSADLEAIAQAISRALR